MSERRIFGKGQGKFTSGGQQTGRGRVRALTVAGMVTGAVLTATMAAPQANAIIGGTNATEDYSFIATLRDQNGVHYCGGALVTPQWVLTAGHCSHVPVEEMTVQIGSNDLEKGGTVRRVSEIVRHPEYTADPENLRHDIALVKLDKPVEYAPIEIAGEPSAPGTPVRTVGWGMTCEDGNECPEPPNTLQQLDTAVVADERCTGIDAESDLCSEHPSQKAQSCTLDSGSPMMRKYEGRWELVGVTSRDGDEDMYCVGPGVWTDAAAYGDWIRTTTGANAEPAANYGLLNRLNRLICAVFGRG